MTTAELNVGNMYYMYTQVAIALTESGGDITPEIQGWIDKLEEALPEKLDTMAGILAYLKGQVDYQKSERQRIAAREQSFGRGIEQIREQMIDLMACAGERKVKTALHTITTREIDSITVDEELLSNGVLDEFIEKGLAERTYKLDKKAITAEYKDWMERDLPDYIKVEHKASITIR